MSEIIKSGQNLPAHIQKYLDEEGLSDIRVGNIYIKRDRLGEVYRVSKIEEAERNHGKYIYIAFERNSNYECTEWEYYSTIDTRSIKNMVRLEKPLDDYMKEAMSVINGELTIEELSVGQSQDIESENSLVSKDSKQNLILMQEGMEKARQRAEMIKHFVGHEMEKRRAELDKIRSDLNGVLSVYNKQIGKIMRVITTIELYLGIEEEIFHLQEGPTATEGTPLSFRQQVLYMDEEMGIWKDGGLDFNDITFFDEWLLKDGNYKKLIPEIKGVVCFCPRRWRKDYRTGDARYEEMMNHHNLNTSYMLIRNGENLYRIFTDRILIRPRLFPKRSEMQELLDTYYQAQETGHSIDKKNSEEKLEDSMYQYRKRAMLLQGLVDRTNVFSPMPAGVSIFKMAENKDIINFIYDGEATLPEGRLPFREWKAELNSTIGHGSRILVTGAVTSENRKRYYRYYSEYNTPPSPADGVYLVEKYPVTIESYFAPQEWELLKKLWDEEGVKYEFLNKSGHVRYSSGYTGRICKIPPLTESVDAVCVKHESWDLTIMHNPKDQVYHGWGDYEAKERKNNLRYKIYPEDSFVLNYDRLSLDDVDFYINSRVDRPNYLGMMPVLIEIREQRLKEIEKEKDFVKMTAGLLASELQSNDLDAVESLVWECVDWWKHKNMIKRPIDKDDAKAYRMITKKVLADARKNSNFS